MAGQVINKTGRDAKERDHVWWDEQTATYIITRIIKKPVRYPHAVWLGRLDRGVFAVVWLALEHSERTI